MKSAFFMEGNKFEETQFELEETLESIVTKNSKILFGTKSVYFDIKNKVEAKSLGGSIPDGILIDFKNKEDPQFYLVEVELEKHDFFKHIFPQITKFFAFYKNLSSRENLIDKIHRIIDSNISLKNEIEKLSGKKEIYKFLKDVIDNSQNILLIINENKPEFDEITKTYTDTWGKMVKIEILKEYAANDKKILTLNPDFENIEFVGSFSEDSDEEQIFDEHFHLEGCDKNIVEIYNKIKNDMDKIDNKILFNPKKYYISIRKNKNFSFIEVRKRKIRIVIMIPYEKGKILIKKHKLIQLPQSVQKFYNGSCFQVIIENNEDIDEIIASIKEAYDLQK